MEQLHGQRFITRRHAKDETLAWLLWCHQSRLHSTLNYVSPMQFEQLWLAKPNKPAHSSGYGVRNSKARSVKVNYGKFGDLLAEVKVVTGKAD